MPSQNELQFIVRVNDQGSASINSFAGGLGAMGQQAGAAQQQLGGLALKITGINQALQLSKEIVSATVSTVKDLTQAYSDFDRSLNLVERVTRMSDEQVKGLGNSISTLAQKLAIVPQQKLANLADEAVTIGVRGSENILKFTETMAKLDEVLGELGPGAAKTIVAVLNATGDGVQGIEKFGNVLTRLRQSTASSVESILTFTGRLAEAGSQFNVATEDLLSLAAAASEIKGLQAQRFGTTFNQTLVQLRDAALQGTEGMQKLTEVTGLTQQQFLKLIQDNPVQAVLRFANALNDITQSGRSVTSFLTMFHLQNSQVSQVLGVLGKNYSNFTDKLATGRKEAKDQIVVQQEWQTTLKRFQSASDNAGRAWEQFKTQFGAALAPAAVGLLNTAAAALDTITALLKSLPGWVASVAVSLVTFGGIVAGAIGTLNVLGAAFRAIGLNWGTQAGKGFAAGFEANAAAGMGGVGKKIGMVMAIPLAAELGSAVGNLIGDALTSDFVMKHAPGLTKGIAHLYGIRTEPEHAAQMFDESGFNLSAADLAKAGPAAAAVNQRGNLPFNNVNAISKLGKEDVPVIEKLDTYSKKIRDVQKDLTAIQHLQELVGTGDTFFRDHGVSGGKDQEQLYVDRLKGRAELEKSLADPINKQVHDLQLQLQTAGAVTQADRDRVQLEQTLNKLSEQKGALGKDEIDRVTREVTKLQQQKILTQEINDSYKRNEQLQAAQAVTREQQEQVKLTQLQADLIRDHGFTKDAAAGAAATQARIDQTNQYKQIADGIDGASAAQRKYNDDIATLNKQLATATPQEQAYIEALKRVQAFQTLAARDPIGNIAFQQQQELAILKIKGDYQDADRKTQQQINQLQQTSVQYQQMSLDKRLEINKTLQDYNRALDDAQKSQNSGFEGWAKSVGSLRDNILDLQKDVATSLSKGVSDGLSGLVTGKGFDLRPMLANIGKKMVDVSVNQLLKQGFEAAGGQNPFFGSNDALKKAQDASSKLGGLSTQAMTVTAASVTINGTNAFGGAANQNYTNFAGKSAAANLSPGALGSDVSGAKALLAHPEVKQAITDAAAKYGVSANALATEANIESRFNPNAAAKTSSAKGLFQFRDATRAQYGGFNPYDPAASADAAARLMRDNSAGLKAAGLDDSAFNLYLAHQQGLGGARKLLTADPNANAVATLGSKEVLNNGGTADMTNAQFLTKWKTQYQQMQVTVDQGQAKMAQTTTDLSAKSQQAITAQQQLSTAQQMTGTSSQTASTGLQTVNTSLQGTGTAAQTAATQTQSAQSGFSSMGSALGGILGPLGSAIGGIGRFGMGIIGLIPKLFSALGSLGGAGGGGGLGGGFLGFLGSIFHEGGSVGSTNAPLRLLPASAWAHAPRFHSGLNDNEYTAILQRGERVLTANQEARTASTLSGLTNTVGALQQAVASRSNDNGSRTSNNKVFMTVHAKDADSFRRSQSQVYAEAQLNINRMGNRNN